MRFKLFFTVLSTLGLVYAAGYVRGYVGSRLHSHMERKLLKRLPPSTENPS